jgi:hypothetical protein
MAKQPQKITVTYAERELVAGTSVCGIILLNCLPLTFQESSFD